MLSGRRYYPVRDPDRVGRISIRIGASVADVAIALGRAEARDGWDEIKVDGVWHSIGAGDLSVRIANGARSYASEKKR